MLQIPLNMIAAKDDDGGGYAPLIFLAFFVVVSLIGALSKAFRKSREQQARLRSGPKPAGERVAGDAPPPSVDEFLEQIRKMAKGETGPAGPPEQPTGLQQPVSRPVPRPPPRPVTPLQAGKGPAPPPPPRPRRPQPAGEQPFRGPPPPPPPRPTAPRMPAARPPEPAPRAPERPALGPWAPERRPTPVTPKAALESLSAFKETASRLATAAPTAAPPKRRRRVAAKPSKKLVEAKPPKRAAPAMPSLGASPAELRAALRQRLAAGPSALREAVLLGEVLGQPIGMRRRRAHRPGGPSRLI